jgi:endonuclease I
MKAIFEFNLPEDQHEYDVMNQASKMQRFLWEFSQQLRSWQKYGHKFENTDDAVKKIREEFHTLINNYEVNLDL